MSTASDDSLSVRIVEDWAEPFLTTLAGFVAARPEPSLWQDRWTADAAYFRWKCAENPEMPSVGAFAYDGDVLLGMAIVTFKSMRRNGTAFLAGELGDLYVSSSHRGRGIFRRLVAAVTQRAAERGAELVYCVPNQGGYAALLRTGVYEDIPAAEHRTWLLPLRPFSFAGARVGTAKKLSWLDPLSGSILRAVIGCRKGSVLARPEDIGGDPPEEGESASLRVPMTADMFRYRVLAYPHCRTYFVLRCPGTEHFTGGILRKTYYGGNAAFLLARVISDSPRSYARVLRAAAGAVSAHDATFVALWAPSKGQIAKTLRRHCFIPVQTKSIAVARYAKPSLKAAFEQVHLDMMDSDKA